MKISVVVPVRNAGRTLPRTIASILKQSYKNCEIIVVDGKSTDDTLDVIKAHDRFIRTWVSEEDAGTSDAMNKGLRMAQGDLVTVLNADDHFADDGVFARVVDAFRDDPNLDVVFSTIKMKDPQGLVPDEIIPSDPNDLYGPVGTNFPGAFFKRSSLDLPLFDLSYKVACDYEMLCRLIMGRRLNFRIFSECHVIMSMGGLSSNPKYGIRHVFERFRIRRAYFGLWPATRAAVVPFATAILRRWHFRPYTWARKLRRAFSARSHNSVL